MSGPGALALSLSLSVLGPGVLLSVSRCGPLCVGARRSRTIFVGSRHSLSWGPAFYSLCRGPPSLCRGLALSVSGPGALSLIVSGPGGLCVGPRRSLCQGPALSVSGPGALALSLSGPGALCLGAQHSSLCVAVWPSLCRGLALSVSGPGALSLVVSGPGGLCVGPRRSLCRGPALSVSEPGGLSDAVRGSHCQGPTPPLLIDLNPYPYAPSFCSCCSLPPSFAGNPRATYRPRGSKSACQPFNPAHSLLPGESPKPYYLGDKEIEKVYIYISKQVARDPESVRQWLLQSWVRVCSSRGLFLKARMHH